MKLVVQNNLTIRFAAVIVLFFILSRPSILAGQVPSDRLGETVVDWTQWRGPQRDGSIEGPAWPATLSENSLKKVWSVTLGPGYSGPIVVGDQVFTTETRDKKTEVVTALERSTGKELWSTAWDGALSVPFFAKSNGDWIRATPAYSDGCLYIAGMRDVLMCLDTQSGTELWRFDFPQKLKSKVPTFGFVSSPLIDGDAVFVQAGGGLCKLNRISGELIWKSLEDGGGMSGSAFSSPIIESVAGKRQLIVQTRESLCGIDLETGKKLWSQEIPSFRGMNILTPVTFGDNVFTSTYGGTTQMISVVAGANDQFQLAQRWKLPAEGYMTTPVVIDGMAYTHLKNQRFACYDLVNGVEKWRSKPYGKYASLIANGDNILALTESGELLLLKANPEKFDLRGSKKVGDDSWAHLAIRGNQIFVRNLNELAMLEWVK